MWQILLLLMSCESSDDGERPVLWYPPTIHGGTEEQQDAVMDTWSEFIDDIKLTPPNVRVEFVESIGDQDSVNGLYSGGVISLRSDLTKNFTTFVMYHELCHSIDHQRGVNSDNISEIPIGLESNGPYPLKASRRETFAMVCALRPAVVTVLDAILSSCDDVGLATVTRLLLDDVFLPADDEVIVDDVDSPASSATWQPEPGISLLAPCGILDRRLSIGASATPSHNDWHTWYDLDTHQWGESAFSACGRGARNYARSPAHVDPPFAPPNPLGLESTDWVGVGPDVKLGLIKVPVPGPQGDTWTLATGTNPIHVPRGVCVQPWGTTSWKASTSAVVRARLVGNDLAVMELTQLVNAAYGPNWGDVVAASMPY